MNTYSGQQRPRYILLVLLAMAILLDRFWIAGFFPEVSGLAGVNPIVVFLDIPVYLPVLIDLPVIGLFFLFYFILLLSYPSRYGASTWQELRKRLWGVATGALAILLCLSAGGGLYYLFNELLPRQVRNGIDSFGIQADIYTPIPDHEVIHLRGSMVLLVCFLIGMRIFIKRTGGTAEPVMAGSLESLGQEAQGLPEKAVDPRIAGFQEKRAGERAVAGFQEKRSRERAVARARGKYTNPAEREFAEQLEQKKRLREKPEPGITRPKTAAASIAVVAPVRVELLSESRQPA
jgi:hypothetical protein